MKALKTNLAVEGFNARTVLTDQAGIGIAVTAHVGAKLGNQAHTARV
jgi:hypothetical protein